jgi:hypothetical protein
MKRKVAVASKGVAILVIVVIGVVAIGFIALNMQPKGATSTSSSETSSVATSIQIPVSAASAQDSSLGLKLDLSISVSAEGALTISTNESNLLDRVNNVTSTNEWLYPNTGSYPCGNWDQFPTEYAVLQGYYDVGNYSSASSLTLYNTTIAYPCPTMTGPIAYLLFSPLSDNSSRYFGPSGSAGSLVVSDQYAMTGYWTGSGTTASFHKLPSGTYTVLAEDEWGNIVLLHFTAASGSPSTFAAQNLSLQISRGYLCGKTQTQCTTIPEVVLYAAISVHATSPLSCVDTYVNGTMEGEDCWNLVSPGFPYSSCSGSGNQTTCTTGYLPNNNTQTTRAFTLSHQIIGFNGTNGGPNIREGQPYLTTLVALFEDGSATSVSTTVVAVVNNQNSTTPISAETSMSIVK